jgi:hypothetical protein
MSGGFSYSYYYIKSLENALERLPIESFGFCQCSELQNLLAAVKTSELLSLERYIG